MSLRIHNTLTRKAAPFEPIEPGRVRMYVCGMTTYDYIHMGHARMMMAFDVVQRWLRASGYQLTYVQNITDIEDKIIKRAVERGISIRALTDEMIAAQLADLAELGVQLPDHQPRATDYVAQMLGIISVLEQKGLAYRAASGDVNYAVRKFAGYGKLSGKSLDDLRAGERVAVGEGKDDPLDFVLWKAAKADEPADAQYPSSYGPGRPGWHIECSAMSCALLGERFDIHGGGSDLQFPHHENEIAQSEGALGHPFVNVWMHNGFLNVDGEKMSKSLGNFFTVRDVLKYFDGETVRFFMLRTHYRSPFNYADSLMDDARTALRRLYTALHAASGAAPDALAQPDWASPAGAAFKAAMDDDFNTPGALAVLFDLAASANKGDAAAAAQLKALGGVLGLLQQAPQAFLQRAQPGSAAGEAITPERIEAAMAERQAAKAARDFARADAIRAELATAGVQLQDGAGGTTWVRA